MNQIEHDPEEQNIDRKFPSPWPIIWPMIIAAWIGYLALFKFDWLSIALGGLTGMMLAAWAIEVTGNKVPPSWRAKPPRRP